MIKKHPSYMLKYISLIITMVILSACSSEQDDLAAWTSQIKAKTVTKSVTVPELKEYINLPYTASNMVSPFSLLRVVSAVLETPPDGDRPKEPLESIPLENISFIGLLKQDTKLKGMVKIEGKVYQVSLGNHIGQNYGKVVEIKDNGLTVKELIKDGENKWIEKIITLPLQEGA